MKKPGQVILFRFPQTDLNEGKLRPAILLKEVPGEHKDWLICMISSQQHQFNAEFDEIIRKEDADFVLSGLKSVSVVRALRLAVVDDDILIGSIGEISQNRLSRITSRLGKWISDGN